MLATLHRLGLYDAAGKACADEDKREPLRIALDALAARSCWARDVSRGSAG